jgi:hypothetical protein
LYNNQRVGDDNVEVDDEHRKMNRDDFDFIAGRIDRMELTVASAISKVMK